MSIHRLGDQEKLAELLSCWKNKNVQWRPSWPDKWIIYIENCEEKELITMIILYARHFSLWF
jgi:hypothetical protein